MDGGTVEYRPIPTAPENPANAEPRPTSSPSQALPRAPPPDLSVRVPVPLTSAPAPTHRWPSRAPRAKRVPRLRACSSPRANFPIRAGPRNFGARGPRGASGPRAEPNGCLAGSGPEPPGWAAASQRSTVEKQVELHDWGGAGGVPGGRPGSRGASGCAHKAVLERSALPLPARSAPRSSSVSPGQTSGSEAGAVPLLDPAPLSER